MACEMIALMGGTFDPPHVGHLAIAHAVRVRLGLDEIRLVVAGDPWQKHDRVVSAAADRADMLDAAVADALGWGIGGLVVDRSEIGRRGPTYTIDTVIELRRSAPSAQVALVLGADVIGHVDSWHRASELASMVKVVGVARPGAAANEPAGWAVEWVELPPIEISSTAIRSLAATGQRPDFFTTPGVVSLIEERGLYRPAPEVTT